MPAARTNRGLRKSQTIDALLNSFSCLRDGLFLNGSDRAGAQSQSVAISLSRSGSHVPYIIVLRADDIAQYRVLGRVNIADQNVRIVSSTDFVVANILIPQGCSEPIDGRIGLLRDGLLDLDLKNQTVSFRRGFVQGRITPLKTEASRTNLPMPDELVELLLQWHSVTPFNKADDWVFASPYTKGKRPFWPAQLLKKHIKPTALAAD